MRNHSYRKILYEVLNKYMQRRKRRWGYEEKKRETEIERM